MGLIQKIFGTYSERELKSIYPIADKIEALEEEYRGLTDEQLQAKTPEFKQRLQQGETLDDILPEAFAAVREAADRVLGLRPYRVQLIGGIVLHQGRIAEMKTGEGKTLVATLPAYLNALTGNGVHIVTVNDYLAKRDSEWMGKVHRFMVPWALMAWLMWWAMVLFSGSDRLSRWKNSSALAMPRAVRVAVRAFSSTM